MSYAKYSEDQLIQLGKENYDRLFLYCQMLENNGFWEQARNVMKKSSTEMLDLYVQSVLMNLAVHCGNLLEKQQSFMRTVTMTNPLGIPEKGKPNISAYKESRRFFELPPILLQLCGVYDKQNKKDMSEYFLDSLLNILICMAYLNDGKDKHVNDFIRKYYDKVVRFVENRSDSENNIYIEHKLSSDMMECHVEWLHNRRTKKKRGRQNAFGTAIQEAPSDNGVNDRESKAHADKTAKDGIKNNGQAYVSVSGEDKNNRQEYISADDENKNQEHIHNTAGEENNKSENEYKSTGDEIKKQQPAGSSHKNKTKKAVRVKKKKKDELKKKAEEAARKQELVEKFAQARKLQEEKDRQEEERIKLERIKELERQEELRRQEEELAKEQFQKVKQRIQERERAENEEKERRIQKLVDEMNTLVGLSQVKEEIKSLINLIKIRQLRQKMNMPMMDMSYHMVFTGSPGTGKTTVARLVGRIYKELGILTDGKMIETDRSGLVAGYVGQTALKVHEIVEEAIGGVLFIDEAYALVNPDVPNDFGGEAVDTLVKLMEDHRDNLVIIVAGYTNEMKRFLKSNTGLISRFNKFIDFPDYSKDELIEIMQMMAGDAGLEVTDEAKDKAGEFLDRMDGQQWTDFGNARGIRNLFEKIVMNQANRLVCMENPSKDDLMTILPDDVELLF